MMSKTVRRRWLSLLLALTMLLSLAAPAWAADDEEGGGSGGSTETTQRVHIQRPLDIALDPGTASSPIEPILENAVESGSTATRLVWETSDQDIATTDYDPSGNGRTVHIRAQSPGVATISVYVRGDEKETKQNFKVTVNGIALDESNKSISVLENASIVLKRANGDFEYFGSADPDADNNYPVIVATSDKPAVARVSCNNDEWTITGISEGRATITVAMTNERTGNILGNSVSIVVEVEANLAETIIPPGSYSNSKPLNFAGYVETQIAQQCKTMISDADNALSYITSLTVPSSKGTLYLGYQSPDNTGSGVGSSLSYYVSGAARGPYIKDIYFVPNPSFHGSTSDITFTGTAANGRTFKGTIRVKLEESSTALSLTTPENTPLKFSSTLFSRSFQSVAGAPLNSITFALPSASQGVIYRDYVDGYNYGSKISSTDRFTLSELDKLSFVPAEGFVGEVVINYAGYTASGSRYDGELTIKITPNVDGVITYYDGGAGFVTFSETDFDDYSRKATGQRMGWVAFSLPSASQGTIYYNWQGSSSSTSIIAGEQFFYHATTPNLNYLSFVPADGFEGVAKIPFNGQSETGETFKGTVEVHIQTPGGTGGDITYTCLPGSSVKITSNDFNTMCLTLTGQRLHYITFQALPDFTMGALYHNRTSAGVMGTRVARDTKYFNSAAPYIMNLSFWATESFNSSVEIPFTGAAVNGQTFSGSLVITSAPSKVYNSTIVYNTIGRSAANFVSAQFDDMCRDATNSALNYIRFTGLPSSTQGNVYFNYQTSLTPATISTGDSFYLSGEISVSHLSFLPAPGFSGTVNLPFTGWSITGAQFTGTVQVNVTGNVTKTSVFYTTSGKPVQFSAYDFNNEGGGQPVSLRLNALPNEAAGKLYYQYTDPTHYSWLATAGMQYGFVSDPLLGNLTFVPKAGYRGTVVLPYTATNSSGGTYTGEIQIAVEPTSLSSYFYDLQGYSTDVVSAVEFLYSQGVVNGIGTGRYAPSQSIRRGDFCLMLYRAFQFSANGAASSFRDVPASAYYAQAVNVLRSQGIVSGVGNNSLQPNSPLSRQDAAVMIQRTLKAAGLNANDGTEANLAQFTDSAQVDGYARGAVSCLVQQGFWPSAGETLNPKGALTRADMAVMLHRAMAQ